MVKIRYNPSPLEKGVALHLNKFSSPLPKVVLCKVWLKLAQPVLERLIDSVFRWIGNKTLSNQSIFPQEPLGQEDFYMLAVDFHYHFALWKDVALHLNKLEFSSPNNTLCQVWLRLAQLFWRIWFSQVGYVILLFCFYLPSKKCVVFHLSITQGCLVPSLVDFGPVVLEKINWLNSVLCCFCNISAI